MFQSSPAGEFHCGNDHLCPHLVFFFFYLRIVTDNVTMLTKHEEGR
jgi:hypothetical protein